MKDRYLDFVNSPFGASVARSIGLPQPEVLRRHAQGRAEFGGIAAVGAGPSPTLFEPLTTLLTSLGMTSVAHESALGWLPVAARHGAMSGRFEPRAPGAAPNDRVRFTASSTMPSARWRRAAVSSSSDCRPNPARRREHGPRSGRWKA